jgi:exopolyphosphatase/guanosine-5'-triphosphate,3'-diphosphate pyrophosphatase
MEAMLRVWPVKSLRVADRGLREGILATLIAEDVMRERTKTALSGNGEARTDGYYHDQSRAGPNAVS